MCCLRPILHWREIGFRVHLLVCSRRLNTTIWKSYILQSFYTFSGGDVNSLTKVHNSKWSTLKRTSSMPGNMNFMETGILRWNFTFNNSLVGSNACNIAPWKLNIKVECPISLLPIAYCLFCLYFVCCPIPNASNIAPSKLNIKVECSISLLPIAYFAYWPIPVACNIAPCKSKCSISKLNALLFWKGGVWQIFIKMSKN